VTVTGNWLYNNISPDGLCGILVAGKSPDAVVTGNDVDCTAEPATSTRSPLAVRQWSIGDKVTFSNNTLTGAQNAGIATACGTPVSGPYDNSVSVISQLPSTTTWQVRAAACSFNGITTSGNTSTLS
jgi:hypothetical protein